MASVHLRFTPPPREDLTKLLIYEGVSADGPWGLPLETVTEIGLHPNYIDHYTTDDAVSNNNWFTIAWEDSKGAVTDLSNPVQGGTQGLVGEIMDLVEERDHTLDTQVVRQETEFAVESYYGGNPYAQTETSFRKKIGIARLVQARAMVNQLATTARSGGGWTAGLVAMKSDSSVSRELYDWLLKEAAKMLGLSTGRIVQMATMVIAGGQSAYEIAYSEPVLIEVE